MQGDKFLKEKGYNVPVIDPIPLAVNSAYVLAKLKLSQSKKCYPYPPEKGMVGFEKPKLNFDLGFKYNLNENTNFQIRIVKNYLNPNCNTVAF